MLPILSRERERGGGAGEVSFASGRACYPRWRWLQRVAMILGNCGDSSEMENPKILKIKRKKILQTKCQEEYCKRNIVKIWNKIEIKQYREILKQQKQKFTSGTTIPLHALMCHPLLMSSKSVFNGVHVCAFSCTNRPLRAIIFDMHTNFFKSGINRFFSSP